MPVFQNGEDGQGPIYTELGDVDPAVFVQGNGGGSALGSSQPGRRRTDLVSLRFCVIAHTYCHIDNWSLRPLTFGHGGRGGGGALYFAPAGPAADDFTGLPENGMDGCVIIQW